MTEADCESDDGPRWQPTSADYEIVRILSTPMAGETVAAAFCRRELELRALFERLDVSECRTLQRRLEIAAASDPVVNAFGRMIADRRNRLLTFLADARRREALRVGHHPARERVR